MREVKLMTEMFAKDILSANQLREASDTHGTTSAEKRMTFGSKTSNQFL